MSGYLPGIKIFKEYRYRDFLGEGGYGRVFLVENEVGQLFALKVLHKGVHLEERGIRDVLKIRSVRLVNVLDFGKTESGDFCVLMEYVRENLEDLLRDGKIDEGRARHLFMEILKGLEDLEKNGIVHRDIKPANLFLLNDVVKIGDFGSARYTSGASSSMSSAPYTVHYNSPERFTRSYGYSVDRWAATVVFCRMLCGRYPFDGRDQSEIFGSIMEGVPDLSGISGTYHALIKRNFEKQVESRYESAQKMREAFELLGRTPDYRCTQCGKSIAGEGRFKAQKLYCEHCWGEISDERKPGGGKVGSERRKVKPAELKPGETWIEPETGMELVWVAGGPFWMGQTDEEKEHLIEEWGESHYRKYYIQELPRHRVFVDGFLLGKTEVTVGHFRRFIEATGYVTNAEREGFSYAWTPGRWEEKKGLSWRQAGIEQDDRHPVVHISWNDAEAMAEWLTTLEQGRFRLPAEAEWEYACRAGTNTLFHFGETISTNQANYHGYGVNGKGMKGVTQGGTTVVASFPANAFGLYDMHGNVTEWCEDVYSEDAYSHHPSSNPTYMGDSAGSRRVLRGGSWFYGPSYARCAHRDSDVPESRNGHTGFRLAMTP